MPVGSEWYLVDMRWLQEVVAEPTISELPTAPGSILGLFNLRGEIVPLFDTGVLLGLAPTASAPFALVVETDLGPAGLAATGVACDTLPSTASWQASNLRRAASTTSKRVATRRCAACASRSRSVAVRRSRSSGRARSAVRSNSRPSSS